MIKNFFLTLNKSNIRYMLISGQATVLYGAATFSEDIDLWVSPESENWRQFIQALRKVGAKVYKATPPLSSTCAATAAPVYVHTDRGASAAQCRHSSLAWNLCSRGIPQQDMVKEDRGIQSGRFSEPSESSPLQRFSPPPTAADVSGG